MRQLFFTKNSTNVIFSYHQKKLVWDKANVEKEINQELNQSKNQQEGCSNLNQIRTDRRTVELRFSWEGMLSHTWISPWHSEMCLLSEMDLQKEICDICTYEWKNQCISEYMFDCWISTF